MARHGKAHGHSHGHFWLTGLPALAAGLFLMIYMPTLPVVSGTKTPPASACPPGVISHSS